ncbi:MAG: hypothetical protein CMN30_21985 [Sandaracinus sp.]|nr:hypothetical protein [Sandaracinus sp.]
MEGPTGSADEPSAFDEGRRLFLANDLAGAIREFEAARRAQPDRAAVYKELGRAHMRAGHLSQARSAYQRYLELAPDADDRAIVERLLEGR